MAKVKTALIGHGHLGKFHAQKIDRSLKSELVAIVEPIQEQHDNLQKLYPATLIFAKPDEVLDLIDAVIIATPTSVHYSLLKLFISNNKHILCEKPVVESYNNLKEISCLLQDYSSILQVGHSERFHACWDKFDHWKNWTHASFKRLAPFKNRAIDVDVVNDLMIHDIDLMLWSQNEKPISVESFGSKTITDTWDYVHSTFKFQSGKIAHIEVARGWPEEERVATFSNKQGHSIVNLKDRNVSEVLHHKLETKQNDWTYEARDHLMIEQEMFYEAILNNNKVPVTFKDGANAVILIDKVIASLNLGSEVVLDWGLDV